MRVLITLSFLALAACANAKASDPPATASADCFLASSITNYDVVDLHTVNVRVGANRHYIFGTTWNARELDWSHAIAVRTPTGQVCTGNGLGVEISGGSPRQTYPITSITRAPDAASGS